MKIKIFKCIAFIWQGPTILSCAKHKLLTYNVYVVDSCIYHGRIGAQAQSSTSVLLYEP